jgi:hypothetical protein
MNGKQKRAIHDPTEPLPRFTVCLWTDACLDRQRPEGMLTGSFNGALSGKRCRRCGEVEALGVGCSASRVGGRPRARQPVLIPGARQDGGASVAPLRPIAIKVGMACTPRSVGPIASLDGGPRFAGR